MSAIQPMKVVLVEDSPELCESWVELLTFDGHQVKAFLDGRSLLEDEAALRWCDVVITDYYLPDVNGVELVGRIRALREELPVIMLSGMRDSSVINLISRMPRATFLPKPTDVDDLEAAMARLVGSAAGTRH